MAKRWNRRQVLGVLASAGAGALAAPGWLRGGGSPNEKLALGVVGCGGQGGENLKHLGSEKVVALCDVDERSAAGAFKAHPDAKRFRDYRKMLDEAGKEIDALVVSIPDHMHAAVSLAAMRLGKHVYCEKPLTWSIEEARLMAKTAAERKVATQMGTQGMAGDGSRAGIEVIRSGVLGDVKEMHVWTDRAAGWWPQGVDRPADSPPVPKDLDWDLWLGVAPERPYHPDYCPFKWRGWKDFGTGPLGDMGIHNGAMPFVALRLGAPTSAEVLESSGLKAETFPTWATLRYEFPAAAGRGPVTLWWYDGGKKPPASLIGGKEVEKNGAIVVGSKGTLYSIEWTGGDWHLFPEDKFRDYHAPTPTLPRAPDGSHHQDWFRACKGGPPAFCNFVDFGAPMTEAMLVGGLAVKTGKKIEWDAEAMRARGCPEADPFIRRQYRGGRTI